MHTPGPWRSLPVETGEYYTRHIEITGAASPASSAGHRAGPA